jgi:integrase
VLPAEFIIMLPALLMLLPFTVSAVPSLNPRLSSESIVRWVFIDYHGQRKARKIGSREAAERVKREIKAKLALGDLGFMHAEEKPEIPTFTDYATKWTKRYAEVECKYSTVYGYKLPLERHLKPEFGHLAIDKISREHTKDFAARLAGMGLSRNSVRRVVSLLAEILNAALDDRLIERNPAIRILRSRKDEEERFRPMPLTPDEQASLLDAARADSLERYALLLLAMRAGLRRGEIVALQWGDIQFGSEESDSNRFIEVKRNCVYGRFTSPKNRRSRQVDMSAELRRTLMEQRDARLLLAFAAGKEADGPREYSGDGGHLRAPDTGSWGKVR